MWFVLGYFFGIGWTLCHWSTFSAWLAMYLCKTNSMQKKFVPYSLPCAWALHFCAIDIASFGFRDYLFLSWQTCNDLLCLGPACSGVSRLVGISSATQCRNISYVVVHRSVSVRVRTCYVRTCPDSWLQLVGNPAALIARRHSQYAGCSAIAGALPPTTAFVFWPTVFFLLLLCWCAVPISQLSTTHTIRTTEAVDIHCVTHDHSPPTQCPFPL